jgi:hypothetical protein
VRQFEQKIILPGNTNKEQIPAKMENGMLDLAIPGEKGGVSRAERELYTGLVTDAATRRDRGYLYLQAAPLFLDASPV